MVEGDQRNWKVSSDDWSGKCFEWKKFKLDTISYLRKLKKER